MGVSAYPGTKPRSCRMTWCRWQLCPHSGPLEMPEAPGVRCRWVKISACCCEVHPLPRSGAAGCLCYHRGTHCQLQRELQYTKQHVLFQCYRLCYYQLQFFLKAFLVWPQPMSSLNAELSSVQSQGPLHWLPSTPNAVVTTTV